MISIDKGLLGKGQLGDVVERHKEYGKHVDQLDIIVFSRKGFEKYQISENVMAYPTNSCCKLKYPGDAKKLGRKLFKESRYDLIVTQDPFLTGWVGRYLKRKLKAKLLVHFHGDFWQNKNWLEESSLNWLFLLISKSVVPHADAIRVMSEGQKEKLKKFGDKVRVISTPVDLDKFQRSEIRDQKSDTKVILHVGRDDKVKDYNTLVRAFKLVREKNPGAIFWQAGANKKIEEAMKKNSFSDIAVFGVKDNEDLLPLFTKSAIFALSSTSESFGKVLVEANACGKPVVAFGICSHPEIVKNGILVKKNDIKGFAKAIMKIFSEEDGKPKNQAKLQKKQA